jgi:hypothetical protein
MTLREMAEKIRTGTGQVSRYVSPPDASGSCRTVWGETITQGQYFELLRLCRRGDQTPEQMRVMRAHDEAVNRRR